MNIFIIFLVFLFMAGYFLMDSPSQNVSNTELSVAISRSDLRSVAECAAMTHISTMKGFVPTDICLEQFEVKSGFICLSQSMDIISCDSVNDNALSYNYIMTTTMPIEGKDYNAMMELLDEYYSNSGAFGVYFDNAIMLAGGAGKRKIPKSIANQYELKDGQLVYFTQYEAPAPQTNFEMADAPEIICPPGTSATYRFRRWQCIAENITTTCTGDMIWDEDLNECIADESKRPLCDNNQTAVLIETYWTCIDPFLERTCPDGMTARLNYTNLTWECVEDANEKTEIKKCENIRFGKLGGTGSQTLRLTANSCTDCETLVIDETTCDTYCMPDAAKVNDDKCYKDSDQCTGYGRAIYFGFPSMSYAIKTGITENFEVPFGPMHSQNRRFNCMDCSARGIDEEKSYPPYIVVCE